jgi:Phosphotransferase enzyme family
MTTQLDRKIRTYVLLNQVAVPRVLMVQDGAGWSLPTITPLEGPGKFITKINQAMYDEYEIVTTYLHRAAYQMRLEEGEVEIIEAIENHSPTWMPRASDKWIDQAALNDLTLTVPHHRAIIEKWIQGLDERDSPPHLAPWQRLGWLPEAMKWISRHLAPFGITPTGSFRQFAVSPVHFLLEVQTTAGRFYLKGVRRRLASEQPLTCALARWQPNCLPEIVAADNSRLWWLMRDIEGQRLDNIPDVRRWEEALRNYAELQINCAERIQELLILGCPDYRLPALAGQIDWLFTTAAELKAAYSCAVNDNGLDYHALAFRLKELCSRLADYGLPSSIGHGDLNTGNIIITDERCVYIDWATGYVGHPFLSAAGFPEYAAHKRPELKEERSRLRQAYLEPWSAFLGMDDLQKAYQISKPLALLCYITHCAQIIVNTKGTPEDRGAEAVAFLYDMIGRMSKAAYSPRISN